MPIVDRKDGESVDLNLILAVIEKQGESLHSEISEQGTASRAKMESIYHELDSGIKDLQAHNTRQNGTIMDLVKDVGYLKKENIGIKQRSRDLKNFQMNCDAVKVAGWIRKKWWVLIIILALVFAIMEWLYHDSMLLHRITLLFERIKIFKP